MRGDIRMGSDHVKTVLLRISFVSPSLVLCQLEAVISIHVTEQRALQTWLAERVGRNIAVWTTLTLKEYMFI